MKKLGLILMPLMAVSLLASCNKAEESTEYKVSIPDTNGVTVTPDTVAKGKDYAGTIKIATDLTDQLLPATLDKVTSGNKALQPTEYTYTLKEDKLSADFKIPAANIVGDVAIQLTLVDKPVPSIQYDLIFNGTDCGLYYDKEGTKPYTKTTFTEGTTFNGFIIPNDNKHYLPTGVSYTSGDEPYTPKAASYDASTGALSITMDANITVTAISKNIEWYEDNEYLTSLTQVDITKDNGVIQTIKVNGLDQRVRLIGVGEDYGTIGVKSTEIHTTWEFVDVFSDENGFSLAAFWNDTATTSGSNNNYKDSTIRACLNGTFDDPTQGSTKTINWFQYYGKNEDTIGTGKNRKFSTDYSGKSVLSMLPGSLVNVLKTPSKYINVYSNSTWKEETIEDKLFLLSPVEMGRTTHDSEEAHTSTYTYYKGADNTRRIKHQYNWDIGARTDLLYDANVDGSFTGNKCIEAGYNPTTRYGSTSWLRSPNTSSTEQASFRQSAGNLPNDFSVYERALSIAPAFCI